LWFFFLALIFQQKRKKKKGGGKKKQRLDREGAVNESNKKEAGPEDARAADIVKKIGSGGARNRIKNVQGKRGTWAVKSGYDKLLGSRVPLSSPALLSRSLSLRCRRVR